MSENIQILTRGGYLTIKAGEQVVFNDQIFETQAEAYAEAATLDKQQGLALVRPTSEGKWAILVCTQKQERKAVEPGEHRT